MDENDFSGFGVSPAMMQTGDADEIAALKKQMALAQAMRGGNDRVVGLDLSPVGALLGKGMKAYKTRQANAMNKRLSDPGMQSLGLPDDSLVPMPKGSF